MKLLGFLLLVIVSLVLFNHSEAWPVAKAEMINGFKLDKIPQFHCLRYFKHDVQLLRRCRNIRMLRRPLEEPQEDN